MPIVKSTVKPLVLVTWLDAASRDEWHDITDDQYNVLVCHSAGYLVRRDRAITAVAATVSNDDQACCVIMIPTRMIISYLEIPPHTLPETDA